MYTLDTSYDNWLHFMANKLLGWPGHPLHDDLVQEGRIAMWRAEQKHNPELGALPSWVTRAAEMRMKDLAHGHGQPFGREATRGKREVEISANLEGFEEDLREEISPMTADLAEEAMWAYHHGELARTIARLTPPQQRAVRVFLGDGLMTPQERAAWTVAKRKLQSELEHLRETY